MADNNTPTSGGMKKELTLFNFFTIGFGAIIGTGWVLLVGDWMVLGGGPIPGPTIISLGFAVLVIVFNFRGAGAAAKLSSFLTKALLAGMVLAMLISFATGSPSNALPVFSQVIDAAGGSATEATSTLGGIVAVLVMTPFFYAGFDTIPQQAEEASANLDWKKFGLIPAIALLASGVFYLICIYSFGTIIDWHEFVLSSVPALAVLERINIFFYIAMLIIATLGPLGPMNSFFGASTRLMLAMGRKEMLPKSFAEIDPKSGAPKNGNIVMAVLTLVGPFLGRNMLVPLTNVASLGFIFACTMAACACLRLRKTEPNLPRPYKVNGGKVGIGCAIAAGAIVIALMVLPFSPAALNGVEWAITAAWVLIGILILALFGNRHANVDAARTS